MKKAIVSLFILYTCTINYSQVIENVNYNVLDDQIDITYDLVSYKKGQKYNIVLKFVDDKGKTIIPVTVEGDIGIVKGGLNKRIIWNVLNDIQEFEGRYKAVITLTKPKINKHSILYNANIPWDFFGIKYAYIGRLGCYTSLASDFGLLDETSHFTGGLAVRAATRTNIYFGGGLELSWGNTVLESGIILKFNHATIDSGLGFDLMDSEYNYFKFAFGYSF